MQARNTDLNLCHLLICFSILALTACTSQKHDLEPLRVFPGPGPAASLFQVAEANGYFKEQGLNVTLQRYETGLQSLIDLKDGLIDVAHPTDFAFVKQTFSDEFKNMRIIGSVIQWNGIELVARRDHGIVEPEDLKGKNIAIALDTQSEFAFAEFLILHNMSIEDVTMINMEMRNKVVEAIVDGEVDAAVTINQFAYEIERSLGENATIWQLQEVIPAFPLLVTTKENIEANPGIYVKLLKSLDEAIAYANDHPEDIKKIAREVYGFNESFLDFYWQRIRFEMTFPQELILLMESESRWLINNKRVNATDAVNYLNFIYFETMEQVKPEAITIIRP